MHPLRLLAGTAWYKGVVAEISCQSCIICSMCHGQKYFMTMLGTPARCFEMHAGVQQCSYRILSTVMGS